MEEIDEIMGFDPSQLTVFQEKTAQGAGASNIYKPRPIDSKSDDGIYRAVIKPIYNPFNVKQSVLERQSYWITDAQGGFEVVTSLTNNDTSCPIFTAWKKCHYAKPGTALYAQQAKKEDGGNALFDKRYGRYIIVQILEDVNHPELEGQYMFWKCPKAVWEAMENKMAPAAESKKASIPVMDFLFGRAIELEVKPGPGKPGDERYTRETSYATSEISEDVVSCTNPDKSSLLTDDQQEILDEYVADMKKVWKEKDPTVRASKQAEVNAKENTKLLKSFYKDVMTKIKEFCPNIVDELGYKPWEPEVAKRVQAWIDIVLSGNVPQTADAAPAVLTEGNNAAATTATAPAASFAEAAESDDDLPF